MNLRAASIASGGLAAQALSSAVLANNVANVLTPTFRAQSVSLAEAASGGVRLLGAPSSTQPGGLIVTGHPLDFAIGGAGFFILDGPDGPVLTRAGAFDVNANGMLVDSAGRTLRPGITLPAGATAVGVNTHGEVVVAQAGGPRAFLGTVVLGTVANPAGLVARGDSVYGLSSAAGPLIRAMPGQLGFGVILQGALEASNVDLVDQAVRTVASARAFDANAAVFRMANAMAAGLAQLAGPEAERKQRAERLDMRRTQAARLVHIFGAESQARSSPEPMGPELRARLSARRMTPGEITESYRVARRHVPERMGDEAGGDQPHTSWGIYAQELQIARRQAAVMLKAG